MSQLDLNNISYAILFCKSDKRFSKTLLKIGDKIQINYLLELVLNYLVGNLTNVAEDVTKDTHRYKRSFIKLLDKRTSLQTQKKILYKLRSHISQIIVPFLLNKLQNE